MRISNASRNAPAILMAVAILSGCANGGAQVASFSTLPRGNGDWVARNPGNRPTGLILGGIANLNTDHGKSWMASDATNNQLLYVSDAGRNDVYVYSYPKGKLVGTLTGFNFPEGECVDNSGNVWIVNTGTSQIAGSLIEYAHAGTTPIATLDDTGQSPVGCSINKRNGTLAVTNLQTASGGPGSISIYKKAQGNPANYSDPSFSEMFLLDYDDKGNIFVDGINKGSAFQYAELPRGSKTFKDITLNQNISYPGGVQFTHGYIALGDQLNVVIYHVSGSTITGSTKLNAARLIQFCVRRYDVTNPDLGNFNIGLFKYPSGQFVKYIARYLSEPVAAVVSP